MLNPQAANATWESFFHPHQYSAVGITSSSEGPMPHMEIVSFNACDNQGSARADQIQFSRQKFDELVFPPEVMANVTQDPQIAPAQNQSIKSDHPSDMHNRGKKVPFRFSVLK